jgi:AraC-like DNA-binding protein
MQHRGGIVMGGASPSRHVAPLADTYPAVIAVCGLTRHLRQYVDDGLRRSAQLRYVDTFDDLDALLPSLTRCDAVILAPVDARARTAVPTVQRLVAHWPLTAIVILFPAGFEDAPSPRALVAAGAHGLVFEGVHPTATRLAIAVETARRDLAAESVLARLASLIPPALHAMVQQILLRGEAVASVDALANALGVHRKTLFNRCERAGFLQPAELIMWCRLAMVAHRLETTGATVESIANDLGFPSHTTLRNRLKSYTGRTATEIRESGGLGFVLEAMRRKAAAGQAGLHIR